MAEPQIVVGGILDLGVADAAEALDEHHHRRHPCARDLGGVVERTAVHPGRVGGTGQLLDHRRRHVAQLRVEGDRRDAPQLLDPDRDALLLRDPLGRLARARQQPGQHLAVRVALIDRQLHGLGDDGRHSGRGHQPPGRELGVRLARRVAQLEQQPRRGAQRLPALLHRRRAGVGRLAVEADHVALDADRPVDHRQRQAEVLEHGPLLDVELDVAEDAVQARAGLAHPVQPHAVGGQHLREGVALAVGQRARLVEVQRPGRGARAEHPVAEPRALLVGPVDELQRDRRAPGRGDGPQHLEAAEQAEGAVEPAAVGDGVDVAADDERLRALAGQRDPLVSGGVEFDLDVEPLQAGVEPAPGLRPGVGPAQALRAVLVLGQLAQRPQVGQGARRIRLQARRRHG